MRPQKSDKIDNSDISQTEGGNGSLLVQEAERKWC